MEKQSSTPIQLRRVLTQSGKLKRSISESDIEVNTRNMIGNRRISACDVYLRMDCVDGTDSCPKIDEIASRSCSCLPEVCLDGYDVGQHRFPSYSQFNRRIYPFVHDACSMQRSFVHTHGQELPPYDPDPLSIQQTSPRKLCVHYANDEHDSPNSSNCQSSAGPLCRICLDGDHHEELISPCRCTGTMALIHKSCLERWLNLARCNKCELCRYTFLVDRSPKPFWQMAMCSNQEVRRSMLIDLMCFLILTPLVAVSLYLCISAILYYRENPRKRRKLRVKLASSTLGNLVDYTVSTNGRNASVDGNGDSFEDGISWDIVGLVMLACILLGIYVTWLSAAIGYYTKTWRRWSRVNQALVLSENHRRPSCFSVLSNTYQQMEEVQSPESTVITNRRQTAPIPYIDGHHLHVEDTDSEQNDTTSSPNRTDEDHNLSSSGLNDFGSYSSSNIGSSVPLHCPNIPQIYIEDTDLQQNINAFDSQVQNN